MFIGGLYAAALVGASLSPVLDLDFVNNPTASVAALTFARASGATYFDATGTMQTAGNNVPRIDYDPSSLACRGLLVEEQRTNVVRNPRCEGAVAGTPGTWPTYWANGVSGLSTQVVGTGSELGIPFVDIRVFGTASASSWVLFEATQAAAAVSQAWSLSAYWRLVGGSLANVSNFRLFIESYTSGGSWLADDYGPSLTPPTTSALSMQRVSFSVSLSNSSVGGIRPFLQFTSSGAVDFTLRIGGPQLEQGALATSLILPSVGSPAASTRAADYPDVGGLNLPLFPLTAEVEAVPAAGSYYPSLMFLVDTPTGGYLNSNYFQLMAAPGSPDQCFFRIGKGDTSGQNAMEYDGIPIAFDGSVIKQALVCDGANWVVACNGTTANGALNGAPIAPAVVAHLGYNYWGAAWVNGYIRRARLWRRALSNPELQQVTT